MFLYIKHIIKYLYFLIFEHDKVIISPSADINWKTTFEGANAVYENCKFGGSLGYGSYIQKNCELIGDIGRFTSIAPYTRSNCWRHPYTFPYVTTSPMFFSTYKQTGLTFANRSMFDENRGLLKIGNDVWICENVFLVGGINVGDGAVILPGAVVTKDIPPYAIAGGIPAKVIRYRYDEETISFLLNLKWWDKDIEWLKDNWELLCDIDKLKDFYFSN